MEPVDSYFRCIRVQEFFPDFYRRLLESDAVIPPLSVGVDRERQYSLLRSGIVMLLLHAGGNAAAASALERIGRRHGPRGLGLDPGVHQRWMGALLDTVRACDPHCTADVEAAWRDAVGGGLAVMAGASVVSAAESSGRTP